MGAVQDGLYCMRRATGRRVLVPPPTCVCSVCGGREVCQCSVSLESFEEVFFQLKYFRD
jgi:hypothetical protein